MNDNINSILGGQNTNNGANASDNQANSVNNPQRPIGTYVPGENPAIGSYNSEISELTNIARSNAFSTMAESLQVDGGAYLAFNRIQDQETFNTNFASNFTSLVNSFVATLESQHATSSALDQIRDDIDLIQDLLNDQIDADNDTPDMFEAIDTFINNNIDDLSATAVFKLRSMAVTALENTYNTIEGALVHNSYEYLNNLPAGDINTINQFLDNLGLENLESMTNSPELMDALSSIVVGAGIDGLRGVYQQVRRMFAEQDPRNAARIRAFRDRVTQLRLLCNSYMSSHTSDNRDAVLNLANEINRDYPATPAVIDVATLLPNNVESINPTTITPERALGLRGSLSDALTAYQELNDALNATPQEANRVQAARIALSNLLPDGVDVDTFIADQEALSYNGTLQANLFEYLGLQNITDYNSFRNQVLPAAAPVDLATHVHNINNIYGTFLTVSDLTDNAGNYDANVDLGRLIGINGSISDAILNYNALYTNLNGGSVNGNLLDAQITRLNNSFISDTRNQSRDLLLNSATTLANNLPATLFELLNVRGISTDSELTNALNINGRDVDTFVADLSQNNGINFDRDAISVTTQAGVDFGILDHLQNNLPAQLTNQTVNLTADQAAIALMGIYNQVHAANLNQPVNLSPEASLKTGVISFVSNRVRREMQNIRQQFQTQNVNLENIRATQGPQAFERMESEYYSLDYKEAMLSLALDLSIMSPSVNSSLKQNLEILADDFSTEDFESIATNMTDQQLLTISAELNSFAEGNRRSTKHGNRRIVFRSNEDVAMVKKFTSCAIEFIQKRSTTNMLKDINLQGANVNRTAKLQQLALVANTRMNKLASIVDRAYVGSQRPANYRFMLGVRQEIDSLNKQIRGFEMPWSLERGFTAGFRNESQLVSQVERRGFNALNQHGNLVSPYGKLLTTVSDLLTSPIWLTRKGFRPTINTVSNTARTSWNAAKWTVVTPFNVTKKVLDGVTYSAGWLAGAPIRIPVNIVKGVWNGAIGA